MKKLDIFLDIGSSKITLFACSYFHGQPIIVASSEGLYDGFMDGEFFEATQITDVVQKLFVDISQKLNIKIKRVFVGVPSEFSVCVCKRKVRKFLQLTKVTSIIARDMFDTNDDFGSSNGYKLISASPMQYQTESGFKTIKPEGNKTSQLILDASYILAKESFISRFDKLLHNLEVEKIEYISPILGQIIMCSRQFESNGPIALIDVGHITTSVCILKGEGLALLSSFSLGGGHITADLMQLLKKSFKDAELIKRKVSLTLQPQKDEKYIINSNGETISSHIQITNDIVRSRIENIAQIVNNILDIDESFENIPVYLTGDGICNFKGVINIFEKITNRRVYEFSVPLDNTNERFQTSSLGMAEVVKELK